MPKSLRVGWAWGTCLQNINTKGGRGSNSLSREPLDSASHDTHMNLLKSVPHQVSLRPQLGHWLCCWRLCFKEDIGEVGWAQSQAWRVTKGWQMTCEEQPRCCVVSLEYQTPRCTENRPRHSPWNIEKYLISEGCCRRSPKAPFQGNFLKFWGLEICLESQGQWAKKSNSFVWFLQSRKPEART